MFVIVAEVVPSHCSITVNVYVCIYTKYGHACIGGHSSEECVAPVEGGGKTEGEREKEMCAIED